MILLFFNKLRVEGIALYPFVLLKNKNPSKSLINHERIHLRQQLEMGILPFYVWYLAEYGIHWLRIRNHYWAYRAISFEKEAYKNDQNLDYLKKRRFWAFLRYL